MASFRITCFLSRASLPLFSPNRFLSVTLPNEVSCLLSNCPSLRLQMSTTGSTPAELNAVGEASAAVSRGVAGEVVDDRLVQYVVLRRDLIDTWPLGSVVTQGCHAAVSAVWTHAGHPDTAAYCSPSNIDSMHKVTLEVKGETQLRNLAEKLSEGGIDHKLWIEQPENIPTCIATRPYPRSQVASHFKKLKLCK